MKLIRNTAEINGVDVVSTSELCKFLGITMSAAFITDLSEVRPFYVSHVGTYWKTDHVPLIGMAAAAWLIRRAGDFQLVLNAEKENSNAK